MNSLANSCSSRLYRRKLCIQLLSVLFQNSQLTI